MTLKKGHNSTKENNPDLKKYVSIIFFDEESIYEISKLYLNTFCNGHTDRRTDDHTDGPAESNMPLQLFQSEGHKTSFTGLKADLKPQSDYKEI